MEIPSNQNNHKIFPDTGHCLPLKKPDSLKNDVEDYYDLKDCILMEAKSDIAHAEDVIAGYVGKMKEFINRHLS